MAHVPDLSLVEDARILLSPRLVQCRSARSVASIAIRAAPAHARAADRRQGSYGTSGPAAAALTRHCAGIRTLGQPPGTGPRGRLGWRKRHAEMGQGGRQGGGVAGWSFSWDPWTRANSLNMRHHHILSVRGRFWKFRHAACVSGQRLRHICRWMGVRWLDCDVMHELAPWTDAVLPASHNKHLLAL